MCGLLWKGNLSTTRGNICVLIIRPGVPEKGLGAAQGGVQDPGAEAGQGGGEGGQCHRHQEHRRGYEDI